MGVAPTIAERRRRVQGACSCGDRTRPNINHRKRIPCWTYVGKVRYDINREGRFESRANV